MNHPLLPQERILRLCAGEDAPPGCEIVRLLGQYERPIGMGTATETVYVVAVQVLGFDPATPGEGVVSELEVGVCCGNCGGNVFMITCNHFRGTGHEWVMASLCMICRAVHWVESGCQDCHGESEMNRDGSV